MVRRKRLNTSSTNEVEEFDLNVPDTDPSSNIKQDARPAKQIPTRLGMARKDRDGKAGGGTKSAPKVAPKAHGGLMSKTLSARSRTHSREDFVDNAQVAIEMEDERYGDRNNIRH